MSRGIIKEDVKKVEILLLQVLGVDNYIEISRMGGLTNHTYCVELDNHKKYVVRIPGDGTEELIVRSDEEKSTKLACQLGIDAPLLYFGKDGSKISEYIDSAITMSANTMKEEKNIEYAAKIFKKLHDSGVDTGVPFEVFDMAEGYEKIINNYKVSMYQDYPEIKKLVMEIKAEIDATCDTTRVPCHNDSLCENWVLGIDGMFLIDWEYAGMNDKMWDLADVSIEAGYSELEDELLLKYYFEDELKSDIWKHFLAGKIYVDYLWTLWAKTRVPFDGQPMEDWASQRYERLKENIKLYYESEDKY